ncbi:hypothetical protein ACRS85_21645 [Pluralibacter gergoviae]|uniref:hypothetical protein n=1 Tax=Pluralibacter gergoviae TaxID=61647 RepID=UPI003EE2E011
MLEKSEVGEVIPDNGRILLTCKNGKVASVRYVHEDEHVATLKSLFELAELAGYVVVKKSNTKL